MKVNNPLFKSDQVLVTASINEKIHECIAFRIWVSDCLNRHFTCDYGDLSEEDGELNNAGLLDKGRIMSSYENGEEKIWIITEYGHEITTVLYPEEY